MDMLLRRVRHDPMGMLGVTLVLLIVLCGLLAPWITPYDPFKIIVPDRFQTPSWDILEPTSGP
jgi:peptide/nickel transport system permease protein